MGDPLQLPPTLCSEPRVVRAGAKRSTAAATHAGRGTGTLIRTLFSRLAGNAAVPFVLLRTQYRCHPHIAGLVNRLFYDNQLHHGISEEQRAALVPKLAPITIVNHVRAGAACAVACGVRPGHSCGGPMAVALCLWPCRRMVQST